MFVSVKITISIYSSVPPHYFDAAKVQHYTYYYLMIVKIYPPSS